MRDSIRRDVTVAAGSRKYVCRAIIDADCWPATGVPTEFGGFLDLPKSDWETLASADRLVLTLLPNGELYRMILDGITGRLIARQL